jgi:hypothetical protein
MMRSLAICTCVVAAAASASYADPLAGSSLPQGTRWVIHLDVDGARQAAPLWELARLKLVEPHRADITPKLAVLERITGMKIPQDLHDVTLYGSTFDEAGVCVSIHGQMNPANIVAFLRNDPEFQQQDHNGHDILRWRDKGRNSLMFAGFSKENLVVLSPDAKIVVAALDTLDGKAPALKADSPLAPAAGLAPSSQPIFWLAAENLSDLPRMQPVESPVLAQMDAASLGLRWANDRAVAELRVQAASERTAQQLQAVAEGVKAFVALSAAEDHAPARLRLFSGALQQLAVQADGKTLKGDWSLEVGTIEELVTAALQEQAASTMIAPPAPPAASSRAAATGKMP